MRCPRCHRETSEPVPELCRACGAPLRLADEPEPSPLAAPLTLDRRRGDRPGDRPGPDVTRGGPAAPERAPKAEVAALEERLAALAAVDRSHWDLGADIAPSDPEPGYAGAPPAAPVASTWAPLAPPPREVGGAGPEVGLAGREDGLPDLEVDALEIHLRRPATWRRVAAGAVDVLPFGAGGLLLARSLLREAVAGLPAPPTGLDGLLDLLARERVIVLSLVAVFTLALAVYAALAHALAGATLGKRLLGLRVVGPDGLRPSPARSAVRAGLAVLSAALLGLGFLLALFTRSGRALHDLLARTWVVEAP